MYRLTKLPLLFVLLLAPISTVSAQTPDTGTMAAGVDVGVFFPDEAFENTMTLDGYAEYSITPRISVRGLLGYASPGLDNRTEDKFRQVRLLFNGVYNWERGAWHPYVTGGAGAYFVRLQFQGENDPDGETRGGINFGGGTEYFVGPRTTIKGEARWDFVSDPPGLPDASGFTLTFGVKHYF